MQSVGNGQPQNCVKNILSITRGEVPYNRAMGLDGDLIDKLTPEVKDIAVVDATEQIQTYERRVTINDIKTVVTEDGMHLSINPDITITE